MKSSNLKPRIIWHYFNEICLIPRPSKKEGRIIAYLKGFADAHKLSCKTDKVGNVLISKRATPGMENKKTVILQSHLDMVCEKNSGTVHNFDVDPIKTYVDGGWLKARGTTLGADDGIGIACQLAILGSDNLQHGPIECLFTVDEETGLTGAFALEKGFLSGDILLNLDSEDDGELFMGCAGGIDTIGTLGFTPQTADKNLNPLKVSVTGLTGGHSGDDINKGLGNANKILNRFLWELSRETAFSLASFNGGNLRNAIAREAEAIILVENTDIIHKKQEPFVKAIQSIYGDTEPHFKLSIDDTHLPEKVMDDATQENLLNLIYACPNGVLGMSREIDGLVETSTNSASVKTKDNTIELVTSQRSSVEAAKQGAAQMVKSAMLLAGAEVKHSDGYPGWKPNLDSKILKIAADSYKKLFNEEPEVKAIHAGLECGLFLEKYPNLDMVSYGPTIKGAHSPDERLKIDTVEKFWKLTLEILNNIPNK